MCFFSRVVPWTLANDLSFVGHNLESRIGDSLPQQLMAPWQPCKAIAWKWKFSSGYFSSLGVSLRKQKCSTGLFIYDNGKWKMIAPCLDQNMFFVHIFEYIRYIKCRFFAVGLFVKYSRCNLFRTSRNSSFSVRKSWLQNRRQNGENPDIKNIFCSKT